MRAAGCSYDQMREALLADADLEIAEWARTKGMAGGEREMRRIYENVGTSARGRMTVEDFFAYMPAHSYIFTPTTEMWPATSVNAHIRPIADGGDKPISASTWLDRNRHVEQMTWAPGKPMIIENRLIDDGGWIERDGLSCFNLYRPPAVKLGDPDRASAWLDHARNVYPDYMNHLIKWCAFKVQFPETKINHGLVLGGAQGIGKDTLIEPLKHAVGPWNFAEVKPTQVMARFNGFLKSVILRISEGRDLGDVDRYQFYDHMKDYMAAPPDVLCVDEKHLREHSVLNCTGVIITTNHRTNGLYLPADDRRHYVMWSQKKESDYTADYWSRLWRWYDTGGYGHVAAYLRDLDVSDFDPKAPPPKTASFWDIVDANRAPEDGELADVIDQMGKPPAFTLDMLKKEARFAILEWLDDRKNRRVIPHRLEACEYTPVRNDDAKDGLWVISKTRQVVYARQDLSTRERIAAARSLAADDRWSR